MGRSHQLTAALGGLAHPPILFDVFVSSRAMNRLQNTYIFKGQEEKKKGYLPVSVHVSPNFSVSKNSSEKIAMWISI
jgi:hypothetical protein